MYDSGTFNNFVNSLGADDNPFRMTLYWYILFWNINFKYFRCGIATGTL